MKCRSEPRMTDTTALDTAVRLYLHLVRGEGILTEDGMAVVLIRTAYRRLCREQANTEKATHVP